MSTRTFQEIKRAIVDNQGEIMAAVLKDAKKVAGDGIVVLMRTTEYPNESGDNGTDAYEALCVIGGEIDDEKLVATLRELRSRCNNVLRDYVRNRIKTAYTMAIGTRETDDALITFAATSEAVKLCSNVDMAETTTVINDTIGDIQSSGGDRVEIWLEEGSLFG